MKRADRLIGGIRRLETAGLLNPMTADAARELYGVGWLKGESRRRVITDDEAIYLVEHTPITVDIAPTFSNRNGTRIDAYLLFKTPTWSWVLQWRGSDNEGTVACLKTKSWGWNYKRSDIRVGPKGVEAVVQSHQRAYTWLVGLTEWLEEHHGWQASLSRVG